MDEHCSKVQELMPRLINAGLDSAETIMAFDHIRQCDRCKRELVFAVTTSQAAEAAWSKSPTPAFLSRLWTRVEQQTRFVQGIQSDPKAHQSADGVVKKGQGLMRTTLRTVGYFLTPLGFPQDVLRLTYESLLREFGQIIGEITP